MSNPLTKTLAKTRAAKPGKSSPRAKTAQARNAPAAAGKASRPINSGGSTRTAKPSDADSAVGSRGKLLRAGLSALSRPRAEAAVADGLSRIADSFGLKKLEEVFDNRVAAAMERLGYPSAKELRKLEDQVTALAKLTKPQKMRR